MTEKDCSTCMYSCTRGTNNSECNLCCDYDNYRNGDVEDYIRMQNKHRFKEILRKYAKEIYGFTITEEKLEELAEELGEEIG